MISFVEQIVLIYYNQIVPLYTFCTLGFYFIFLLAYYYCTAGYFVTFIAVFTIYLRVTSPSIILLYLPPPFLEYFQQVSLFHFHT
jgi:hypothetical protein